MRNRSLFLMLCACTLLLPMMSQAGDVMFNTAKRRAELQNPAYSEAKRYCMAPSVKWKGKLPEPVPGLKATEGYGSDNRSAEYAWYVMILAGRSIAGDAASTTLLKEALLSWAKAGALLKSDGEHDTYYALKRTMLPLVVALSAVDSQLSSNERSTIAGWMDQIIPRLDKRFNGDVDVNNHRTLADATLMAWGAYKGDKKLLEIGRSGFLRILNEARPDGSLPLETRRGARATWYMRHLLSSMVTIAEIDKLYGGNLYQARSSKGVSLATIMNFFVSAVYSPLVILPWAAQNHIPGPHADYLKQDMEFLALRGHGRQYMALAEAYRLQPTLAARRLDLLMTKQGHWKERPLIDEYFGGNASCFFWQPGGKAQ